MKKGDGWTTYQSLNVLIQVLLPVTFVVCLCKHMFSGWGPGWRVNSRAFQSQAPFGGDRRREEREGSGGHSGTVGLLISLIFTFQISKCYLITLFTSVGCVYGNDVLICLQLKEVFRKELDKAGAEINRSNSIIADYKQVCCGNLFLHCKLQKNVFSSINIICQENNQKWLLLIFVCLIFRSAPNSTHALRGSTLPTLKNLL